MVQDYCYYYFDLHYISLDLPPQLIPILAPKPIQTKMPAQKCLQN